MVAPASLSVVRYTPLRPFVERINDSGELGSLRPPPAATDPAEGKTVTADDPTGPGRQPAADAASDAVPGGGVG